MTRTRVAFAADLHVDAYGTKIDPGTGLNARLVDFLESLQWLVSDAFQMNAQVLVICGDYTERRHAPAWLAAMIRSYLRQFPGPVVYLEGNHDGRIDGRSIVELLAGPNDRAVGSKPQAFLEAGIRFVALPYVDRAQARAMAPEGTDDATVKRAVSQAIVDLARGLNAEGAWKGPSVLLLHQTISGAWLSESQQAFLGDQDVVVDGVELANAGYDLVVAGHLHRHQAVLPGVIYPGSIDRVDFAEANDPKGYVLASFDDETLTQWSFRENPNARRWVTLQDGDLDDLEAIDVAGAIVRGRFLKSADVDGLRRDLEAWGAFEVRDLVVARADRPERTTSDLGAMTPYQALEAYWPADHPDRAGLLERGRLMLGGLE